MFKFRIQRIEVILSIVIVIDILEDGSQERPLIELINKPEIGNVCCIKSACIYGHTLKYMAQIH